MERSTAVICMIADDSWVTSPLRQGMPEIPNDMQHYGCAIDNRLNCAVFWDQRKCRCRRLTTDAQGYNAVIFLLSKHNMAHRDGLHVALMRQDGIDAALDVDTAAPYSITEFRHPGCVVMLGPTRNKLHAKEIQNRSQYVHLQKYYRETKTQTRATRDTATQILTITAALRTDMHTDSAAYLRTYSQGASMLSVALEPVPRDVRNRDPAPPKWIPSPSSPGRDQDAPSQMRRKQHLDDFTNLTLTITAEQHRNVAREVGMPTLHRYARNATSDRACHINEQLAAKISKITDLLLFNRHDRYKEVAHLMDDWAQMEPKSRRNFFREQLRDGIVPSRDSQVWTREDPLYGLTAENAERKMKELATWLEAFARESRR